MLVEWRGIPIYIVRHTKESLEALNKNLSRLSDPDSEEQQQPDYAKNPYRSRKEEIVVLEAVCTHLSCAPKFYPELGTTDFDADWQGGFFCPCHGSKFDLAGRVYSGVPAQDYGLQQIIRIGHMSGRSNIVWWLQQNGYEADDELVAHMFEVAKSQRRLMSDEEVHATIAAFRTD